MDIQYPANALGKLPAVIWVHGGGWSDENLTRKYLPSREIADLVKRGYVAASIDGANRLQKMLHITWPGIRSTVCIMLILQVGGIMSGASFDQIFNLYSAPVYPVADIIDTYVYRQSFMTGTNFGYTTAIGLLKSVIGVVMIWTANKVTTKLGEDGLF